MDPDFPVFLAESSGDRFAPPDPSAYQFDLSDLAATRARLTDDLLAADREVIRSGVYGTRQEQIDAQWADTEAMGKLLAFEQAAAVNWLTQLRWAIRHFPGSVSELLSEEPAFVDLAQAVVDLERRKGGRS